MQIEPITNSQIHELLRNLQVLNEQPHTFLLNVLATEGIETGWCQSQDDFDIENMDYNYYVCVQRPFHKNYQVWERTTYLKMQAKLLDQPLATCFLIDLQTDGDADEEWRIRCDSHQFSHPRIRKVSLKRFLEIS